VVLAISTRSDPPSALPTNVACTDPLTLPLRPPLKPGAPDTRTIALQRPLGGRVVVDARGNAYQVTSG
jgi:NAD-dependent oxidoreductase involved in siderophore biosynthesis